MIRGILKNIGKISIRDFDKNITKCLFLANLFIVGLHGQSQTSSEGFVDIYEQMLKANKEASSLQEWHASPFHPDRVVAKIIETSSDKEFCKSIGDIPKRAVELIESSAIALKLSCFNEIADLSSKPLTAQSLSSKNREAPRFEPITIKKKFGTGEVLRKAGLEPKQLLLTFDDGPHPTFTPEVLATLSEFNAPAIFFVIGSKIKNFPDILIDTVEAGHKVGSHTWSHPCLGLDNRCSELNRGRILQDTEVFSQIERGHQSIIDVLGFIDPFFRFPYGASRKSARDYLANSKIGDFGWSIDTNDWRDQTEDQLFERAMRDIRSTQSGIVLFHDIHRRTARTLPRILRQIHDEGYTLVQFEAE